MTIKKYLSILAVTLLALSSTAKADESPLTVDLSTSFVTDYMFRGQNLYDGTGIQPSATVTYDTGGYGKLSGNLWMHLSAEGDRQDEKFTELDESITYTLEVADVVGIKLGHLWYTYPKSSDDINDTAEFFGSIYVLHCPIGLNPVFNIYKDYRDIEYTYYELGFSHTFETDALGKGFNVTPYTTFGFASNAETVYADNGLETVTVGVSSALTLGDINVTPALSYNFKVDDNTVNEFTAGLTFAYSL